MRDTLASINKKKHVKLGTYVFSPLMEMSTGIVLKYCDDLYLNNCKKVPLVLCFPQKKGAALWTSIISLTNAFLNDYIDNVVEGIKLKLDDKVSIYNSVCQIKGIHKNHLVLEFNDQTITIESREDFPISRLLTKMSKVPKNRCLNNKSLYDTGKKNAKINRNSISKILIPNDPETINQKNLDSKVLLIAGRGNVQSFQNLLENKIIYGEKLSKTFGLDENLIIKPDLKHYKGFFKDEIKLKYSDFKRTFERFSELEFDPIVRSEVSSLLNRLNEEDIITDDFEIDFLSFVEEYEEEIDKLKFVSSKFPGAQESLPKKLKAVVINDISQLNEYPETIQGFLAKKIPVIFVSDRNVLNVGEIEFYDYLFKANPDYYRINWNRKKIQRLMELDNGTDFIDEELWEQSKRYAKQQIDIKVTAGCELDQLTSMLLSKIKELDEFEVLQKAFYNYFYPALYSIKNSNTKTEEITNLITEFKFVFDKVKGGGLPPSAVALFEKGIKLAYGFEINSKDYDPEVNVFSNILTSLNLKSVYIPCDTKKTNLPTSKISSLVFSGYPYDEYRGKYLLNSVCVDFIPEIKILCWPYEGALTNKYLTRRLEAAYFTDNIDENLNFPAKYLLKEKNEFITEISSFFRVDSKVESEDYQEEDLNYLHTFKYKGYNHIEGSESVFKVNCQILNFTDGTFMFLPKNSKILSEIESATQTFKINNLKFQELAPGLRIFKYIKNRTLYKKMSLKNGEINKAYDILEIWREKLNSISVLSEGNIEEIKDILTETGDRLNIKGARPTLSNIRNWLFDEDMIMPDRENVKLIISVANESVFDTDNLDRLVESYRHVKANRIHLAHKIKNSITRKLVKSNETLEGEIEINIDGIPISVEVKTIASLDSSDYEIEYQNTRKILC